MVCVNIGSEAMVEDGGGEESLRCCKGLGAGWVVWYLVQE